MMHGFFLLANVASPLPPPAAEEIFSWLKVLGALMAMGSLGIYLWRQIQGTPPPGDKFATKEEVQRLGAQVEAVSREIGDVRDEIHNLGEKLTEKITANYNALMTSEAGSRSRIHKEINDVAALVQRIAGTVETMQKLAVTPASKR